MLMSSFWVGILFHLSNNVYDTVASYTVKNQIVPRAVSPGNSVPLSPSLLRSNGIDDHVEDHITTKNQV